MQYTKGSALCRRGAVQVDMRLGNIVRSIIQLMSYTLSCTQVHLAYIYEDMSQGRASSLRHAIGQ